MKPAMSRFLALVLLAAAGIGWPECAQAGGPAARALGPEWIAVGEDRLERLRGGYVLKSGLQLSFGIERVAYVNGRMVSYLSVSIPDVRNITAEQAQELANFNRTHLVQVGPGNVYHGTGNGGLVIQNTLNGQDIRVQTTLDVSVNTLGLLQAINAADALRNANYTAPGTP